MTSTLDSIDAMLAAASSEGLLNRFMIDAISASTTAANSTSGRTSVQRFPRPITLPTLGGAATGAYVTVLTMGSSAGGTDMVGALEYTLGTLTISGNSFADGVTMPTKTVMGTSITTATVEPLLVVTATLTATTPTVTITYTDQDGNTGNTAALTLPTNALINSAFRIAPYLANGDTGIRDVTNISTSAGTGGTLVVKGLLPVNATQSAHAGGFGAMSPIEQPIPIYLWEAGETIAFYRYGVATTAYGFIHLVAVAET